MDFVYNYYKFVKSLILEQKQNISDKTLVTLLNDCGIKASVQRISILRYIMEHVTHPSADEVYHALVPSIPTLSKTTVYNTLEQLQEKGVILALSIDGKMIHFDGNTYRHAHFLCEKCQTIYDIPQNFDVPIDILDQGFSVTETQVYYKGICNKCLTKK